MAKWRINTTGEVVGTLQTARSRAIELSQGDHEVKIINVSDGSIKAIYFNGEAVDVASSPKKSGYVVRVIDNLLNIESYLADQTNTKAYFTSYEDAADAVEKFKKTVKIDKYSFVILFE